MEVRICPGCSHVVDRHFHYCPQCGFELFGSPALGELLDECLRPLEAIEARNNVVRLDDLLSRLAHLEEGLGLLLGEEQPQPCR